jgi:hypothetical protein
MCRDCRLNRADVFTEDVFTAVVTWTFNSVDVFPGCFMIFCSMMKNMAGSVKRKATEGLGGTGGASKKMAGHWSLGLSMSMNDPDLKVEEDELTVTIKDKYPKVYGLSTAGISCSGESAT